MKERPPHDVTVLLTRVSAGDESAPGKLLELVYDDLRHLAAAYMQDERSDHTLQATALVHEAYLRMVDWENVSWENRAQFFAVAAQVMRRVLVDHARGKNAAKREGSQQKLALDDAVSFANEKEFDVLALEEALSSLEKAGSAPGEDCRTPLFRRLVNRRSCACFEGLRHDSQT